MVILNLDIFLYCVVASLQAVVVGVDIGLTNSNCGNTVIIINFNNEQKTAMDNNTINVVKISSEEKSNILFALEGHFLDLKSKNISPKRLTETLSAFANTAGGELYIGIDERKRYERKIRKWRGFTDQESANGHLNFKDKKYTIDETDKNELINKTTAFKTFMTRILGPWTRLFIEEMKVKPEDKWLLSLFIHLLINSLAYSGPNEDSEEWVIRNVEVM